MSKIPVKEGEIKKLPDSVVNRIAAGEVIHRPVNVVKELLENSLDAGATQISITVKNGGLKFIQVQDNGSGIGRSDLEIICGRFTTSKLQEFEDLLSLRSYGFRGEALASVSHVAQLSIISKTPETQCAYKADYMEGQLSSDILPCAGNQGTVITVQDLFSTTHVRRSVLRSPSEEGKKILDVVWRYAIHNSGVAFSLKRQGETGSTADIRTPGCCTPRESIGSLYGGKFAEDLITIGFEENRLGVKCNGLITNPNFSVRKYQFMLFINNRLVDCGPMKRALGRVFSSYIPQTNHPFAYLNLDVPPHQIDVNVHPSKQEVRFLYESDIIERLSEVVENELLAYNQSRAYTLRSVVPVVNSSGKNEEKNGGEKKDVPPASKKQTYDHQLVRTDYREQKIDSFFSSSSQFQGQNFGISENEGVGLAMAVGGSTCPAGCAAAEASASSCQEATTEEQVANMEDVYAEDTLFDESWRTFRLRSLFVLRGNISKVGSKFLRQVLKNHTFVGCVDAHYALIQYDTGLYLTDTEKLSEELFYQAILFRFGNFASIKLREPAPLKECLKCTRQFKDDEASGNVLQQQVDALNSQSAMLKDYFGVEIEGDDLLCLPLVITDYIPQLEGLGDFLWNLAENTDWSTELTCLEAVSRHIAKFCAFKKRYCLDDMASGLGSEDAAVPWKSVVEDILYPAFKHKLFPPNEFSETVFLKLTDLHELYEIFERC